MSLILKPHVQWRGIHRRSIVWLYTFKKKYTFQKNQLNGYISQPPMPLMDTAPPNALRIIPQVIPESDKGKIQEILQLK